jgi:hypothetical protein
METVQLTPEEEKLADILARAIGKIAEQGLDVKPFAGAIVSSLIEAVQESQAA